MKKYFKFILAFYFAALLLCVVLRIALKLRYIDFETGFYRGGGVLVTIFNITVAVFTVAVFLACRLKKSGDEYPLNKKNTVVVAMAAVCGVSMLFFAASGSPEILLEQGRSPIFGQIGEYTCLVLLVISGAAFIYLGITGVFGRKTAPPGLWMAAPPVWQVILLITRYNGYTTVTTITDHLLIVLFMLFNSIFLLGHARTICMQMRRDGRNYAIPAGLSASLFGFSLSVPNIVDILVYGGADMPVLDILLRGASLPATPLIGIVECVFVFVMSLYALCFIIGLMRSIERV